MVISKVTKRQEEFIEKKPKREQEKKGQEVQNIILRVPIEMLERIEKAIEERPVKIPRNTWFLEAASQYLKDI